MRSATLLVLAGGESRRMGRPKALLPVGGTTLIERVIDRLQARFAEVIVSANDPAVAPPGVRVVRDLHPGAGPLAGLESGLAVAAHSAVFAVACDVPFVTAEVADLIIERLGEHDAAVPRHDGGIEPACAGYARSVGPAVSAALENGDRRFSTLLDRLDVAWVVGLDPRLFENVNTPAQYAALLDALR